MNASARSTIIVLFSVISILFLFFKSCVIHNPKPDECEVVSTKVISIREGSTFDIQFKTDTDNVYYINRGLEQGLNLDSLNAKVLNKTVTLHLPILTFGLTAVAEISTKKNSFRGSNFNHIYKHIVFLSEMNDKSRKKLIDNCVNYSKKYYIKNVIGRWVKLLKVSSNVK